MTDQKCPGCGSRLYISPGSVSIYECGASKRDGAAEALDRTTCCFENQIAQLKETNQRLNRRCQEAEAGLADAKRMIDHLMKGKTPYCGGSMGRRFLAADNHQLSEENAQLKAENEKLESIGGENIGDIIASWLRAHGFDGLVEDQGECGCSVDDLASCDGLLAGGMHNTCRPGYKGPDPDSDCYFLIYPTREAANTAKDKQ